MTNLYKVWVENNGYLLCHADTRTEAKRQYAAETECMSDEEVFQNGSGLHCMLIFKGIEAAYPDREDSEMKCVKLLDYDLIMAGVEDPQWAQEYGFYGWDWEET